MGTVADASNPLKGLINLQGEQTKGEYRGPAPVHLWNPPYCGDIDMRIAADGTWYYMNSPIGRQPLARLFSSVLRKDGDDYFLVTPVEKCGIRVDDAPLFANRMQVSGDGKDRQLTFLTVTDDVAVADADHPLRFAEEAGTGGLKPYVLVRSNLEALVSRSLFHELASLGTVEGDWFGVWSSGVFFPMQRSDEL